MSDSFECPVCYTDGSLSGVLEPTCKHKICVSCYSTIILKCPSATCPCCRKQYLVSQTTEPQAVSEAVLRRRELARARYARIRRNASMIMPSSEEGFSMERLHEIMAAIHSFNN